MPNGWRMHRVAWCGVLAFLSGCTGGLANLEGEVAGLRLRLDDSQRTVHAMRARIDDLENRALLLQDEVDTLRLTGMRDAARFAAPDTLPVVKVAPGRPADPVAPVPAPAPAPAKTLAPSPAPRAAPTGAAAPRRTYSADDLDDDVYQTLDDQGRVVGAPRKAARRDDLPVQRVRPPASRKVDGPADDASILAEYKTAYDLYQQGRAVEAQQAFEAFVAAHPRHPYADNAQYWVGECLYDRMEFETARAEFLRVINEHPDGNKVPDAMVKVGLCEQRLGRSAEARRMYDAAMLSYPDSQAAAVAMRLLGEMP